MHEVDPFENREPSHAQVQFNEFLNSITPKELDSAITELRDNDELRSQITQDIARKNSALTLDLVRESDRSNILEALIILDSIARRREINGLEQMFQSEEEAA